MILGRVSKLHFQMNVKKAHFIKEDIAAFDAPFFSITRAEAECMDPQQRRLLETSYRALENGASDIITISGLLITATLSSWDPYGESSRLQDICLRGIFHK